MRKTSLLLVCFSVLVSSCSNDDKVELTETGDGFNIEENILSFKTSDELKFYVDGLKNYVNNDVILNKLKKSYDRGFLPLNPQSEDETLIQKIIEEKTRSTKNTLNYKMIEVDGELFDVDDDLILDDDFASFLNSNREIIVNDTLYTYTENGIFSSHKSNVTLMRNFILNSNTQEYSNLITPGVYQTSEQNIQLIIPIQDPCSNYSLNLNPVQYDNNNNGLINLTNNSCFSTYNHNSGGSNSSTPPIDHTESLKSYINKLTPCSPSNNFMGVFGPDKRCWSSFDGKRRTKTVFWKHNYLVYRSIGVKVKHQKKHWLGWWYASDDNDEIALIIDKAYFKMKPDIIPTNIHNNPLQKVIFYDGKVYNSNAQLLASHTSNYSLPNLPLNAQFTVSDFINNTTGISLSPNQIKNLVYQQTWNQLVSILQSTLGQNQPKTLNYYVYDTALNEIHFMHINVEERRTGRKKINKTFDFNLGITVNFNIYNSGSGTSNVSTSFSFPGLFQYKDADIDFVGASRKGNTWRGSKLVFSD